MDTKSIFLPLIDNGHGSIRANFLLSILRGFKDRDLHIDRFSDSLPSRARNRASAHFLRETNRDYIWFIDSDIIFDENHIAMAMESDEQILAGIYCKKSKGIEPCINTLPGHVETQCGGYQEIARAGTGFLRIHRSVLERMKDCGEDNPNWSMHYTNHGKDEWDFFQVGVVNKEYLSEDWYFCDKARGLGFKVILDTRIQLRHEGSAVFPLEEVIEKLNAAGGQGIVEAKTELPARLPDLTHSI